MIRPSFPRATSFCLRYSASTDSAGSPRRRENEVARKQVESLAVSPPVIERSISTLSGGNQQKVVLAKWLAMARRVLILDEPTRGVDVGAKADIHEIIGALAADGVADPHDLVGATRDSRGERPRIRAS